MKINHISAQETEEFTHVSVSLEGEGMSAVDAVNWVASRLATMDKGPATTAEVPVTEAQPAETSTRRRRSTAEEPTEAQPAETSTRRRRSTAEEPEAPKEEPEAAPEAAPVVRRRRTAEPEKAPEITDADLTRAASDAAAVCGTALVTALLGEFNVTLTGQIEGYEDRKEFLDLLKQNIEEFKAGKGE